MTGGDGDKFTSLLDSCNMSQFVHKSTHLHGHTLDLIMAPTGQSTVYNVKICDFISDHALVKCSIDLPITPAKPKKDCIVTKISPH